MGRNALSGKAYKKGLIKPEISPEKQKKELSRLQNILAKAGKAGFVLLVLALALMIIAPEFVK